MDHRNFRPVMTEKEEKTAAHMGVKFHTRSSPYAACNARTASSV